MKKILVGILLLATFAGGLLMGRYVFPSPSSVDGGYAADAVGEHKYLYYKKEPGAKNMTWTDQNGIDYDIFYGEGDRKGEPVGLRSSISESSMSLTTLNNKIAKNAPLG